VAHVQRAGQLRGLVCHELCAQLGVHVPLEADRRTVKGACSPHVAQSNHQVQHAQDFAISM
jgi:hypothetical protein